MSHANFSLIISAVLWAIGCASSPAPSPVEKQTIPPLTKEERIDFQFSKGCGYIENKVRQQSVDINIDDAGILEVISDTSEIEKKILGKGDR